jgi:hypothetical protein
VVSIPGGGGVRGAWAPTPVAFCCSGQDGRSRQPLNAASSRDFTSPVRELEALFCFLFRLCDVFVLTTSHFENVALYSNSVFDLVPICI